jgi:hypothetical protein
MDKFFYAKFYEDAPGNDIPEMSQGRLGVAALSASNIIPENQGTIAAKSLANTLNRR